MVKNDKLDALIMLSGDVLIEKNVGLYKSTDTSTIVRPKSLDRRVQKNINKEKRKQEFGTFYKYGQRFVAALLIICTLSFAAVMSVKAAREAVWNAIVEFFDDYLSINYFAEEEVLTTIHVKKEPLIEDMELTKQVILDSDSMYVIGYYKNDEIIITYSQGLINKNGIWYDNENTSVEQISIHNGSGLLMFRDEQKTYSLSWNDGVYEYSLVANSSQVSKEAIIDIAETIN